MHFRTKRTPRIHLACSFSVIFFLTLSSSFFMACSKDDQTERQEPKMIVMPIKRPISPKSSAPLQNDETPGKKSEQKSPTFTSQMDRTESETGTIQITPEAFTPSQEEQAETQQETTTNAQAPDKQTEKEQIEIPQEASEKENLYTVLKGDSLSKISEKNEVYGNPLLWTSLFRLNLDVFKEMEPTKDFHHKELPEGLVLRFVTPSEAAEVLGGFGKRIYSVNVLSAETSKRITPVATKLLTNGFSAYICTGTVDDKEWMRLRVGFFKSRSEAKEVAQQIASLLDGTKVWVVKISKSEASDYCGY